MAQKNHSRSFAIYLSLALAWSVPAFAQSLTALEITGQTTPRVPVTLELNALDELPQVEFTTSTIWTDGPGTFSGVPLKARLGDLARRQIQGSQSGLEFTRALCRADPQSGNAPALQPGYRRRVPGRHRNG